jgi:hypothetical protein
VRASFFCVGKGNTSSFSFRIMASQSVSFSHDEAGSVAHTIVKLRQKYGNYSTRPGTLVGHGNGSAGCP